MTYFMLKSQTISESEVLRNFYFRLAIQCPGFLPVDILYAMISWIQKDTQICHPIEATINMLQEKMCTDTIES